VRQVVVGNQKDSGCGVGHTHTDASSSSASVDSKRHWGNDAVLKCVGAGGEGVPAQRVAEESWLARGGAVRGRAGGGSGGDEAACSGDARGDERQDNIVSGDGEELAKAAARDVRRRWRI